VKGHPAHPKTGQVIAEAIDAARQALDLDPGVFSFVHDGGNEVGAALVQHNAIAAVGFTGSLRGGRALFDLCAARPNPIPFFGELGSINPVFVLPNALADRGESIAQGWAQSLTLGAGQFCTNPGLLVLIAGEDADAFVASAAEALSAIEPQTMLTSGICDAFEAGRGSVAETAGVVAVHSGEATTPQSAAPQLFRTTGEVFAASDGLDHEVFGPLGLVVEVENGAALIELANDLDGQLTATLQMEDTDLALAKELFPILRTKAGRVLANGFPTGVEVASAMVHGGPYPASTNFGATSVGTMAIRRFLRPVCFQNIPSELLSG